MDPRWKLVVLVGVLVAISVGYYLTAAPPRQPLPVPDHGKITRTDRVGRAHEPSWAGHRSHPPASPPTDAPQTGEGRMGSDATH